jgi:glycosyltransferase involved in cell wall biosynthesis
MHVITRLNRGGTSTWLKILTDSNLNGFNQLIVFGQIDKFEIEDDFYRNRDFHKIKFLKRKINPVKDFLAYFELKKVIKEFQPDILNTHTFKAGLLGRLAARKVSKQIKLVHTFHGHLIYGYYGKFQSLAFLMIEKWLAKLTNTFIVNGNQTKNDLVLSGIAPAHLLKVILPGLKINNDTTSKFINIRKRHNISQSSIVVGWLGRLTEVKNPGLVLEIAKLLPRVWFLIGGDGQKLEGLKQLKPKNVIFLGWVESSQFWQFCDLALLTSKNEATPFSLVEALFYGLPIISTDVGSVKDVVTSKNGMLANNTESFVKALTFLIKNKSKRLEMARQSKILYENKFSQKNFLNKHREIYAKLAKDDL